MSVRRIAVALFLGMTVSVAAALPADAATAAPATTMAQPASVTAPVTSTADPVSTTASATWVVFGTYGTLQECIDDMEMLLAGGFASQVSCVFRNGVYILLYVPKICRPIMNDVAGQEPNAVPATLSRC